MGEGFGRTDLRSEDVDTGLVYAAAADGAKGFVYMGAGPGGVSTDATTAITDLCSEGVIFVVTHRILLRANPPSPSPDN